MIIEQLNETEDGKNEPYENTIEFVKEKEKENGFDQEGKKKRRKKPTRRYIALSLQTHSSFPKIRTNRYR